MKKLTSILIGLIALAAVPAACFGQTGTDINQAIPIYFGQTINNTIDRTTLPAQVYSLTLAKGQGISATVTSANGQTPTWSFLLAGPGLTTIAGVYCSNSNFVAQGSCESTSAASTFNYQVAAPGTYYVVLVTFSAGTAYQLQVTAQGTPIVTPNPAQAGCLTGQINSITYSLQLIAAGLPDTVSIGGTQLCPFCTVKPPAYPALVEKMEKAMGLGVGVSACYDATGNIFQLTLNHP